jgi:hypothetical protein
VYEGKCACLVGTIANVRGVPYKQLGDLEPDASRPAERWFMPIKKGDVPDERYLTPPVAGEGFERREGPFRATVAVLWIDEWLVSRQRIAEALAA